MSAREATFAETGFGELLSRWRRSRHLSQLALALEAGVSARHLSFMETGRARPSRPMVLLLARTLGLELPERNALLLAAGYAPAYREAGFQDPDMTQVMDALAVILRRHEPFGAVVFDRFWDIVMVNAAYARFLRHAVPDRMAVSAPLTPLPEPRLNLLRLLFGAAGYRQRLGNWEAVARAVLHRVQREAARDPDPRRRALLQELASYPGVPDPGGNADRAEPDVIIPVELCDGRRRVRFISTIATLGTAQEITLQELRIEQFHPADALAERVGAELWR